MRFLKFSALFVVLASLLTATNAQARFLQTDPVGYKDGPDWYIYVQDDPLNHTDPSGLAGCSSDLSRPQCDAWMARQEQGKKDVAAVQKALEAYRKDPNSKEGKAFADAMTRSFGKDALSSSMLAKVGNAASSLGAFYNDAGTAKGGKFDVTVASGWGNGGTIIGGKVAFGPEYFRGPETSDDRRTTLHEPLHLFGIGDRSARYPDGQYYEITSPGWDKYFAIRAPGDVKNNADNYACMMASQC